MELFLVGILGFLLGVYVAPLLVKRFIPRKKSMEEMVYEFTADTGYPIPKQITGLPDKSCEFIAEKVISEIVELLEALEMSDMEIEEFVNAAIHKDRTKYREIPSNRFEILGERVDACVDMIYYILDTLTKNGINIHPFFENVHNANMSKKVNGVYNRDETGKITKPVGFIPPNMGNVAHRAMVPPRNAFAEFSTI